MAHSFRPPGVPGPDLRSMGRNTAAKSTAFEVPVAAAPCLTIEGVHSIASQDMHTEQAGMSTMTLLLTETCGALFVCRNSSANVKSEATA